MLPYILAAVGGYLIGDSLKGKQFAENYSDGGDIKQRIAEMYIALNTKTGDVYVGGLKSKNKLYKDEKGYYLIDGYGKFMNKKYPIKKYFSESENEALSYYMTN